MQGQGTEGRAGLQDSILRFSRPENLKITFLQLFEKKGEGRAGQGLGSERLGAGQHRARAKGTAGCRAGRAQAGWGQGTEGRAGLQDSILRFSRPENLKITFLQLFEKKGEGRAGQGLGSERLGAGQGQGKGRVQGRQGAGRVQGQGTEGRAGLQDSILRFSRPENLKITFLQLFEKKGEGRAGQGLGSERLGAQGQGQAKGRAGCREGAGQGTEGRAGLQDSILRFSRPENLKITFLQLF